MPTNYEIRRESRACLKNNWGYGVLVMFLFNIIIGTVSGASFGLGSLILIGPMSVGAFYYFSKLVRQEGPILEDMFSGFQNFVPHMLVGLLSSIFIFLWSLLLFIPGIIASYRYAMVFFIVKDNPNMDAMHVLESSKNMMKGYKMQLFLLDLSFLGWMILSVLSLGIGFLFLTPYMTTSHAVFYEKLKASKAMHFGYEEAPF